MAMTRFFLTLTLALLFASMSSAASADSATGARAVDEAWRKAILANDLDAVVSNYSNDAVMWLPDAPEARGREAIRKSYAGLLTANTVTGATFANTHYETSGNLSVGWGDFTLTLSPKAGGKPVILSGRFSVIAKKEGHKWVYVVDHASGHPPPLGNAANRRTGQERESPPFSFRRPACASASSVDDRQHYIHCICSRSL
jgi:ketosteroid isomerase-like protein